MDAIPKFLASAFVIVIAVFVGLSLIMCGNSVASARSFYSNAADAISAVDSVYEEDIIKECSLLAEQNGYVLKAERVDTTEDKYYYELVLEYKFVAPFFGKAHTGKVSGYVYPGAHVS